MTLRAVLFDHDGTLVDSEPVHWRMWQQVLQPYGVELSEQQYRQWCAGVPTPANARDLVKRFEMTVTPDVLAAQKIATTKQWLRTEQYPLMPGAEEAVIALHQRGLQLAIVTGTNQASVNATLRYPSFANKFSTVVTCDDVRHTKPAPECYLLALSRLGLSADECIAVEDTEHGMAAAVDAGLRCLIVPNDMSAHHDFSRASAVFPSMAALQAYVMTLG